MKRLSLITGTRAVVLISIVLLASIFGAYKAFTLPTEIEERIAVLNYEHQGEFDYLVYLHASYLFGDIPLETSPEIDESLEIPEGLPSAPKYPAEIIDALDMTFSYRFVPDKPVTNISEQVEVKAILLKPPPIGQEEVILVPMTDQTGDFTIGFSVNVSDLVASSTTTINANVYTTVETDTGPMFESFTQNLTIRSDGYLLVMDRNLDSTQWASFGELNYEQSGEFDYSVHLKPDSPFGAITLSPPPPKPPPPPPPPPLPSAKILGPEETIFTKLFDRMDVTFSYRFESDLPVRQITEEVEINAVLEAPGGWTKTFVLVPRTEKSGAFTVTFPLDAEDFSYFSDVLKTIERETGVSIPANLAIIANVHTTAQTDFGLIDDEFSQTLSTALGEDPLEWKEELVSSKPGAIEMNRIIPNPNKFAGLSINQIRNLSASVAGIIFSLLVYSLVLNIWFKPEKLPRIEEEALRARKKHKDVLVDIEELPEAKAWETVIQLSSLDELIKAADSLLKPVLHKTGAGRHTYYVIDGLTRYEYISEA